MLLGNSKADYIGLMCSKKALEFWVLHWPLAIYYVPLVEEELGATAFYDTYHKGNISQFYDNSFIVQGVRLWNALPFSIRSFKCLSILKSKVYNTIQPVRLGYWNVIIYL